MHAGPRALPERAPTLVLDAPAWDEGGTGLAAVSGLDLLAPRALSLWRVDRGAGRAARLADGASTADGRFAFEALALPGAGAELVVTPLGGSPFAADPVLESRALAPLPPPTPSAWIEVDGQGAAQLVVQPLAPGGVVWILDAAGRPLARLPVGTGPGAAGRPLALPLASGDPGPLAIVRELPDGRRSTASAAQPLPVRAQRARALSQEDAP